MRHSISKWLVLVLLLFIPALLCAQEVAAVTGVVKDATGAVVPGVSVALVNTKTNTTYKAATSAAGVYTINKVLPGPGYKMTFKKEGFATSVVNDIYLTVGITRTQDAQISLGKVESVVEVSAVNQGVTLDTTYATVGNTFNMSSVSQLPVQIRDSPAALLQLQPGVVNATGGSDGLSSRAGSTTGARGDQNNITLDGLDVNDFATGQAFSTVANAPVESIQEFRGETAGTMSASGRGGGAQISMVTKSGSNQFHGSLVEYHRNTVAAANSWFNNNAGIKKAPLIRNQFGATFGGPAIKDKLFFFFNYNGRRDAYATSVNTIVPLDTFRAGSIRYAKADGTIGVADAAALDPQHIGFNSALLQFINSRYPRANNFTLGDGLNTGGYRFNAPLHRTSNDYVTRIDYNMNSNMKLFGRFSIVRDSYGDSVNYAAPLAFPGDPETKSIKDKSYAYVIGHTWTINNTQVNQFTYGQTVSKLSFPTSWNPAGTNVWTFGGGLTSPYYRQSSQARTQPIPVFRDDFTWMRGNHNIQMGGTFKPIKTKATLVGDFNFTTVGLGSYISQLASAYRPADILKNRTAINYWDSSYALALGHIGALSSNYNYDSSLSALPQGTGATRQYRYWELESYIQDTWKVNNALTLTFGLRYQYYSVPFEVNGIMATQNIGFDEYLAGRVDRGLRGISGNGVTPIMYYNLAGKPNNARGLYEPNLTDFAPRFSFAYSPSIKDGWLGRIFGDRKTSVRGGAGLVYDHMVVNALNFAQDQNSYMFQSSTSRRFAGDAATALANDPRFTSITSIPTPVAAPSIDRPYAPFVSAGTPYGAALGKMNYSIDPKLKSPYSLLFNFGIQRELPGHFMVEASYVTRLGRRLIAQADAGQLVDFRDPSTGQWMSEAFANLTRELNAGGAITPQPFFEHQVGTYKTPTGSQTGTDVIVQNQAELAKIGDVADIVQWLAAQGVLAPNVGIPSQFAGATFVTNKGNSNYHGLLMTLHKNASYGLTFDLNYTYSHSIDNASGIANARASSSGIGFICDARNMRVCRGNSDFDIKHIVNGNFLYDLPVGKGKAFLNSGPNWLNQIVGGWNISGIPTWRSGFAFTTLTGAYLMGFASNSPAIFNGDHDAVKVDVHKDSKGNVWLFADPEKARAAFSTPTGFNMGSRNNLRGPGNFNLDLGIGKRFSVTERVNLQFRADAFNALNHMNFGLPGGGSNGEAADITSDKFGKITTPSGVARVVQFGLRLEF